MRPRLTDMSRGALVHDLPGCWRRTEALMAMPEEREGVRIQQVHSSTPRIDSPRCRLDSWRTYLSRARRDGQKPTGVRS